MRASILDDAIDQRIARARALREAHPAAAEALAFYAALCGYQRTLVATAGPAAPAAIVEADFFDAINIDRAAAAVPAFLEWLQTAGTASLARAAAEMRTAVPAAAWRECMQQVLVPDEMPGETFDRGLAAFVAEAVLQPFAEATAIGRRGAATERFGTERAALCPVCGGRPTVGVLREEGHGARRALVCGLCLTQWDYLRMVCPSCAEERFDSLPVYTADTIPYVRVEACDTCHRYLKTIDLTKNGLAAPLVDDVATLTLDLWARERGYERLRPNLLRT